MHFDFNSYARLAASAVCEADFRSSGIVFESKSPSRDDMQSLYGALSTLAGIALQKNGYENAKPSTVLLGYAEFVFGEFTVFVPHMLADAFPLPSSLQKIIDISQKVAVNEPLQILVSGSGVLSGDLPVIGDLDFCEYFERFNGKFLNNVRSQAAELGNKNSLISVSIKWGNKDHNKVWTPFDNLAPVLDRAKICFASQASEATDIWKLDYVGETMGDEVLQITNVAIPVTFDSWEATATGKSWAFQEAMISEAQDPPRELTSFSTLGAYLTWLRLEIGNYLYDTINVSKAAKRAYSLANSSFHYQWSTEIRLGLSKPEIQLQIEREALIETRQMLRQIKQDKGRLFDVVDEKLQLISTPNEPMLFEQETDLKEIIVKFVEYYDDLVNEMELTY